MKQENNGSHRIKVIAAICAVVILAGGTGGVYAFRSNSKAKAAPEEKTEENSDNKADDNIISAGGTNRTSQLSDSLGLENTAVQLTVSEVLVESGAAVTNGTQLYSITADSLAKAEKTLKSKLQSAKNALLEQKISYQTDKNEAYSLYKSELLLGDTAKTEYDNGMASLDSELEKAKEDYQGALDTINNTPSAVSEKEAELNAQQQTVDSLAEKKDSLQQELDEAESEYNSSVEEYNNITAEYNAAAGVVRYLGNALGKDTSGIELASKASAAVQDKKDFSGAKSEEREKLEPERMEPDGQTFDMTEMKMPVYTSVLSAERVPETGKNNKNSELDTLYDSAVEEYDLQKEKLTEADTALKEAESNYKTLSESLNECSSELKEAENSVSALEKEISDLNSSLSKAKSNISKLRSEYNELNASYKTDQLELKNKYDTDMASYENAEYHYKITCETIEDELEEKQTAYDTAEENLRIFNEELSEGYICAKQDGTIYSLNYQEGRSVNVREPFAYYVDENGFSTTVELDQNDVTQVSIGDTVIIYSSDSGVVNGKITAISAGTSTTLADVKFNVTVTADDGAALYVGQSVNVYFNYSNMKSMDFSDFKGDMMTDGERSGAGEERPDFGGGMPEGFDPSNMPDFGKRKDD